MKSNWRIHLSAKQCLCLGIICALIIENCPLNASERDKSGPSLQQTPTPLFLAASALKSTSDVNSNDPATVEKGMTLAQARDRVPNRTLPEFWIGNLSRLNEQIKRLKKADVKVIAQSPGGHPLHLVSYGDPEKMPMRANFNSAIGGRLPAAFCDRAVRIKPVIMFVGPVHGQEVEGLTGLVNLMQIMETGQDLRGKDQTELQALGTRCRLLIIPVGNPDGVDRFEAKTLLGQTKEDLLFWGQGTWSDGTYCGWPESKRLHPMVGDRVGWLGSYFNNKGINPMHDDFMDPMSTEAHAILKAAKEHAPDLTTSLHSHENNPALLRPAYVPLEVQERIRKLAQRCYGIMGQRNLPTSSPFNTKAESGPIPDSFNLASALYHISGTDVFTFECPHGLRDASSCHVTFDQILDIQLALYEGMMRFALDQ